MFFYEIMFQGGLADMAFYFLAKGSRPVPVLYDGDYPVQIHLRQFEVTASHERVPPGAISLEGLGSRNAPMRPSQTGQARHHR